jgi:hypothetical protein
MQSAAFAMAVKHSFANLTARGTGRQAVSGNQPVVEAKCHSCSSKDTKKAGKSVKLAAAGAVK